MNNTSSRTQVSSRSTNAMPRGGRKAAAMESELNSSKRGAKSSRSSVESTSRASGRRKSVRGKKASSSSMKH